MRVYFDYNATTPLAPDVADVMNRVTRDIFGNASSVHYYGQQAKAAIDVARRAAEHVGRGRRHLARPADPSGLHVEREDGVGGRLRRTAVGVANADIQRSPLHVDRRRCRL